MTFTLGRFVLESEKGDAARGWPGAGAEATMAGGLRTAAPLAAHSSSLAGSSGRPRFSALAQQRQRMPSRVSRWRRSPRQYPPLGGAASSGGLLEIARRRRKPSGMGRSLAATVQKARWRLPLKEASAAAAGEGLEVATDRYQPQRVARSCTLAKGA